MRRNPTEKLLSYLLKNSGKIISQKEIETALNAEPAGHKHGRRSKSFEKEALHEIQMLIAELELLNALEIKGKNIQIKDPFMFSGKISFSPRGIAFVMVRGADPASRDIFIAPTNTKGALPGDEVYVRLLDRKRERFEGTVITVIKRARRFYRLSLLAKPKNNAVPGVLLDTPGKLSACITTDRIPSDITKRMKDDMNVIVRLTGKRIQYMGTFMHEADFVSFEEDSENDSDFERILMKYDLDPVYPSGIDLPANKEINEDEIKNMIIKDKRTDHRNLYTVTIDGDDSKDFDDAISIIPGKKYATIFVHIADVSYYVKKDSALDKEALRRATSVYLPGTVIPMLPPVLSENLCSLIQDTNRPAFTAEMEVEQKTGKITNKKFYRSVIRVNRRLTYNIAENELDKALKNGETTELTLMWDIAQKQKSLRIKNGRIDLDIKEVKVSLDEKRDVASVDIRERLKSAMLIEELMLSANTCVAEFLRKKKAHVLYRSHDPMDETKMDTLNAFFRIYNIPHELKNTKPESIIKALEIMKQHSHVARIFNMLLLRSFMQANYRGKPDGHWGLGFKDYCHFTSPIRRYPDLVVHRVLDAILSKKKQPYTKEDIDAMGTLTSEQERKAMDAERDAIKLKVIRYIESTGKKNFRGFITGFKTDRVFLEVEDLSVEGIVVFSHLTNASELVLPDRFSAYLKKYSRPAFLGEEWDLELERIDIEEIRLYFKPIFAKGRHKTAFEK